MLNISSKGHQLNHFSDFYFLRKLRNVFKYICPMGKLLPLFWALSFALNNMEGHYLLAKDWQLALVFSSNVLIWTLHSGTLADRDPMLWFTLFNAKLVGNKVIIIHNLIIDDSLCSDCNTEILASFTLLGCFTNDLGWTLIQGQGWRNFSYNYIPCYLKETFHVQIEFILGLTYVCSFYGKYKF